MRLQILFPLFIGIVILNPSFISIAQSAFKAQFSIIYTNDVMGEVEPCG